MSITRNSHRINGSVLGARLVTGKARTLSGVTGTEKLGQRRMLIAGSLWIEAFEGSRPHLRLMGFESDSVALAWKLALCEVGMATLENDARAATRLEHWRRAGFVAALAPMPQIGPRIF